MSGSDDVIVSVVIATHNRSEYLSKALNALCDQIAPNDIFEVIVVDNASTDKTRSVVSAYTASSKNIRYCYEPTANLNLARNRGWQEAKGKYVAYSDDDAVADKNWIREIIDTFESCNSGIAVIGGKITPIWETPRPNWLHNKLLGALSLVDYSGEAIILDKKNPFGVNVVFRREMLVSVGGFDSRLDRRGTKLISGGETEVIERIKKKGYRVYYNPHMVVGHCIPNTRLQQKWFINRAYWGGYSESLMWKILEKPSAWQWLKRMFVLLYGFARNPLEFANMIKDTENSEDFLRKNWFYARLGQARGMFDFKSKPE